jgi:NAD(P)H-hydrate epimerase
MSIPALTTEQMIEVDRLMIEEYGITLMQMMENAGRNLAALARRMLNGVIDRHIVVLCGAGNNGGGGLVAARHLMNWGARVSVKLVAEESKLKEMPAQQYRSLKKLGAIKDEVDLDRAELIIDALIGYGLQGNPRGSIAEWIDRANRSNRSILALDAPSGLDTTIGMPGQPCIKATATMTLALPKIGLLTQAAKSIVGELYVADISVPPELYQRLGFEIGSIFAEDSIIRIG